MSNMSYCRFENALRDLRDCDNALWDEDLSDAEVKARSKLIKLCRKIADACEDDNNNEDDA